jgi:phage replication initiation protein
VTRPNSLVLDGSEVKYRLQAERTAHKTPVHIDWVRFTCILRNAPAPSVDILFPRNVSIWDNDYREAELQKVLREVPDCDFAPTAQAIELATQICGALGDDFRVSTELRKGHDFYRYRWSIERHGVECGWVGFLSSGDSPRQQAQAKTIHANLYGTACTFANTGWNERIADIIQSYDAKLTRADLALDFFDGYPGGMEKIRADFDAGLCNSQGKRLKCNMVGDWSLNPKDGRSFYFGSKEAGKQTNAYEKGHQLFGFEAGSNWLRIELRYGNKLRVLPVDMLRRPADFFAGASQWHALALAQADAVTVPQPVKTKARLAIQTIEAEVSRAIRWAIQTAGPSLAMFVKHATEPQLFEVLENKKLPARMQKFSQTEIGAGFLRAISRFSTVDSAGHAYAAA